MSEPSRSERVRLTPLTREEATLTAQWRYPPPLAIYDGGAQAIEALLGPANNYQSIWLSGEYVGYVCVGADARVPGLDADAAVDDIGIGLTPALVDRGLSRWLLPAVIDALDQSGVVGGDRLRAVVLDWNLRSLAAAQHAGFVITGEHSVDDRTFVVLTRPRVL